MSEWKPIDTAPKDGTAILARSSNYKLPFVVFWSAKCIEEGPMPALPTGSVIGKCWLLSNAVDSEYILYEPEEWIELPEQPK